MSAHTTAAASAPKAAIRAVEDAPTAGDAASLFLAGAEAGVVGVTRGSTARPVPVGAECVESSGYACQST